MSSLREALFKAGAISEKQKVEADAREQLQMEMVHAQHEKVLKEIEKRLGILQEATSPDDFRREARKLLLQDPQLVQAILNIAHERGMQNKADKGGRRLIANLYQVRALVRRAPDLSKDALTTIVDKEFPKK